jgi:secondary thiamine-phosphate synthase enzyme
MVKSINIKSRTRTEFIDITLDVSKTIEESGIKNGICYIYIPHTTAAITINEGADPSVVKDIQTSLSRLIPHDSRYLHSEGNSDAHIKTSIIGSSVYVIVEDGRLLLGTWQSIFFCEFDGPRHRRAMLKIISG